MGIKFFLKHRVLPHVIGFFFIFLGWWISLLNVALDKFSQTVIFNKTTLFGLFLILVGAYLPDIWIHFTRREE